MPPEQDEKTEPATPKRREESREKGQVSKSREVTSVAVLVAGIVYFNYFGGFMARTLIMADIAIMETDRDGLQRRKFRPFVPIGVVQDAQVDSEGAQPPEKPETPLCESSATEKAA